MKRRYTAGICLAAVLAVVGPARADGPKAEVIHWWTSGGESAAVKVLAEAYNKAGGTWVDTAIAGGENAESAGISRIVGGNPPTAMQFNTGKQFDDLVENSLLADLDAQAKAEDWAKIMPAALVAAVTRDGHIYALPLHIHGIDWLFYSKAAFAKAGATEPTNWEDIFPALDKLKAAGLIPLALSSQPNWENALFDNVLIGKGGKDLFVKVLGEHDADAVKSPEFRAVAETFRKLHDYIDPGASARKWNDATTLLIQGKAGMQVMGDWAKGEFSAAGQTPGKEYGCTILSDHGPAYVMGGDIFVFPKTSDQSQIDAQHLLAKTMLEPATQIAFVQKKGSIPIRTDIDTSSLDECARKGAAWMKDPAAQVPANELLSSPEQNGALQDVVSQYWNNAAMSTDDFVAQIAAIVAKKV